MVMIMMIRFDGDYNDDDDNNNNNNNNTVDAVYNDIVLYDTSHITSGYSVLTN